MREMNKNEHDVSLQLLIVYSFPDDNETNGLIEIVKKTVRSTKQGQVKHCM